MRCVHEHRTNEAAIVGHLGVNPGVVGSSGGQSAAPSLQTGVLGVASLDADSTGVKGYSKAGWASLLRRSRA